MREKGGGFWTRMSNCKTRTRTERENGDGDSIQAGERKEKRVRTGKDIKGIFWNVAGTATMKEGDWDYVRKFDIIGLAETWEEEDRGKKAEAYMKDYVVRQKFAIREKKRGRAKGGLLLAIRKSLVEEMEWEEKETDEALAASWRKDGKKWVWGVTYMRHSRKGNYKVMEDWIENNKEGITIISGDFNARTAGEGGLWDSEGEKEERKSKDKVINEEGRELIDYVIRNEEGRHRIQELAVGSRIKSDHLPIEVRIEWKRGARKETGEEKEESKKKVTRWDAEGIEVYLKELERGVKAKNWKELKESVAKAMPRIEVRGKREEHYEEKWWDEECHKRKEELKRSLKDLKELRIGEEEWRKRRREYRNLIECKKRNKGKEWLKEIEMDKGMRLFWNAICLKKRNGTPDESITKEQWRDHFRGQYIMGEVAIMTGRGECEEEEGERLEDISTEEVREAIKKLKKKKAAGQDQIANKAWIYGGELIVEELKDVLNGIWRGGEVPGEWKTGMIKPIHKKGDKKEVENYRGITLMDTGYKIYAEIVRKRLEKELEEKKVLDPTQMGFREGKETAEAIYVLKEVIRKGIERERGKVLVCFADMRAAFDRLKRDKIWERLARKGVNVKLVRRIRSLFEGTRAKVMIGGEVIDEFGVKEGLRQGCPLSPTLFNVAMSDLEEEMGKVQGSGA